MRHRHRVAERRGARRTIVLLAVALLLTTGVTGAAAAKLQIGAWVPYWDQDQASKNMRSDRGTIESASPFWFQTNSAKEIGSNPGAYDSSVLSRLRKSGFEIIPTVTTSMGANKTVRTLGRAKQRKQHIKTLKKMVRPFDGIDFNYEQPAVTKKRKVAVKVRRALSLTFEQACKMLRRKDKICVVTVMARTSPKPGFGTPGTLTQWVYDYARIGEAADRVRVMTYDQHGPSTGPGPIAGYPWVGRVIDYATSELPAEKLELGIPLYGRDWGPNGVGTHTWRSAEGVRKAQGSKLRWSARQRAPYFRYGKHTVWYNDARSAKERGRLARREGLRGVYLWTPGAEDPDTWKALRKVR